MYETAHFEVIAGRRNKFAALIGAVGVASLLLAGCAGQPAEPESPEVEAPEESQGLTELTKITVAMQPVASSSSMQLARDAGIFEEHNLDVEFVEVPTSEVSVSSLVSNSVDFGQINPVTAAVAVETGLPVAWTTNFLISPAEENPRDASYFVNPDSGIESWADLNGKNVQVSCMTCTGELWLRAAVDSNGGDSSTLNLVVMPAGDALPALGQGSIDAAAMVGGLVGAAERAGLKRIGGQAYETAPSQPLVPFGVNVNWAANNMAIVEAFNAALVEVVEYATANRAELELAMQEYYPNQVPSPEAAAGTLAFYESCFRNDVLDTLLDYTHRYGFTEAKVARDDLFLEGVTVATC